MNCTDCTDKICRKEPRSCAMEPLIKHEAIKLYQNTSNAKIVDAAAQLVDNGRAGKLSRTEEIVEFARTMNYKKIGLAYCYGMEKHAEKFTKLFTEKGFDVVAISCSIGGLMQSEVNAKSCIHKVSCNPIGLAYQLNAENVDLTLIIGICLGHDILLQRNLENDFTTLVVKDRVFNHNPLKSIE
jgi:uncharacterized metal-binding protein